GKIVSETPGAISYIATTFVGPHGTYREKVKPLCIDGARPGPGDVASNRYQFWNFEHLYTKGPATGLADQLIQFISSEDFQQKDVPRLSFLPLSALSETAKASHQL